MAKRDVGGVAKVEPTTPEKVATTDAEMGAEKPEGQSTAKREETSAEPVAGFELTMWGEHQNHSCPRCGYAHLDRSVAEAKAASCADCPR
jgi:hypothetical protein